MNTTITIEHVEALADLLTTDQASERARLHRLILAEARILGSREPRLFERTPLEYADEAGHWDTSYPPTKDYRDHRGPRLLAVRQHRTEDHSTSGGYYYEWRRATEDLGLFVGPDGTIYGCDERGTGRVGRFAAHPGNCDVLCQLIWEPRNPSDLAVDELRKIERYLRSKAFPAATKAE